MWNSINEIMPEKNKYVLGHTPFCKYKCATVFFNGIRWRSADDSKEVWNIKYWQELPETDKLT